MEEACKMGLSGGFEQGKPETALPELKRLIPVNTKRVNPQNKFWCGWEDGIYDDSNTVAAFAF